MKMIRREVGNIGERLQGKVLAQMGVDVIEHPVEPPGIFATIGSDGIKIRCLRRFAGFFRSHFSFSIPLLHFIA